MVDSLLGLFLPRLQFDCCFPAAVGLVVAVALAGAASVLSALAAIVEGELAAAAVTALLVVAAAPSAAAAVEGQFDIAPPVVPFVAAVVVAAAAAVELVL